MAFDAIWHSCYEFTPPQANHFFAQVQLRCEVARVRPRPLNVLKPSPFEGLRALSFSLSRALTNGRNGS
jgi:hypothetical protein